MIGVVGMRLARVKLALQSLLLGSETDGIESNPSVAHIDSPIRRNGPPITIGGTLNVIEFGLARPHIPFGARHRRRYLPRFRAVCLDIAASLPQVSSKRLPSLALPVSKDVMNLAQVVAQLLQRSGAPAGCLEDRVDCVDIPTLNVRRSQRAHSLRLLGPDFLDDIAR
jgi:hypothetical protein